MKKSIMNILAVFILSIVMTLSEGCGKEDAVIDLENESVLYDIQNSTNVETAEENFAAKADIKADSEVPDVTVYVCGAVKYSGVYSLKGKPRVVDAIEAAGGMDEFADTEYINQAQPLADGQKIYVPTKEETEKLIPDTSDRFICGEADVTGNTGGKVNINTAGVTELTSLPGIGQAKAELIIEYRNSNGRFESIEDIMKISGIKEGMFNKIKDKICI